MNRKSGLGRGLDALLPTRPGDAGIESRADQSQVAIDDIDPNPRQPRGSFDDDELQELARSIAELGVLQPLLVREASGGRYELIAGERRLRAARQAGLDRVPVMVVETDDRGSLERAIVENIHRANLNPIEEAAAYKQMIDDAGLTQEALGERLGRNRVTITNALRLLELPTNVQRLLMERRITAAHGKALMGLAGNPMLERIARRVDDEDLSVRETEELVRRYQSLSSDQRGARRGTSERPAEVAEAQRRLADHLQTRVRVEVGKRKGKVVLDFVSVEELNRLVAVITGETEGPDAARVTPQ